MLKVVEIEGLKFYNLGGTQVNVTREEVTEETVDEVEDIDCFNIYKEELDTIEKLERYAEQYVSDKEIERLNVELIESGIIGKEEGRKLVCKLSELKGIRENHVLAYYKGFEVEGDILCIESKKGDSIAIDLRLDSLGEIVG